MAIPTDIREEFPILQVKVSGRPLIYLDNTATSQTPREVVEEVRHMYYNVKANVHRGVHTLSQAATEALESTRRRLCSYINAESPDEVIFTRGTTEAINLVASSIGALMKAGDEIILTVMDHHSNIVPWQMLAARMGMEIKVIPMTGEGQLDLEAYRSLFTERTRMVAFCHVSNVLGTINPAKEIIALAHAHGAYALVDGAQALPHSRIDVRDLDADFYAFSAHKMYGPTGVGVLYGKRSLLEAMPPYQGGGEMIAHVRFDHTTFADLPFKFEAGTPDYVDIAAFSKALDFIERIGIQNIEAHEIDLTRYTMHRLLTDIPDIHIYGPKEHRSALISFNIGNAHHYDVGMLLDKLGVAVRTGHHCAQPLMQALGIEGCVRASFAVYNTRDEADRFIDALKRVAAMLS